MPLSSPIRWERYRSFRFLGNRTPCNLCGEEEAIIIGRRDRWLQPLIYVMCRRCGLILNDYYERHFWKRSQGAIEPTPKQIRRSMRDAESRLVNLAPLLKPGIRILDVGAGGGEFVALAERRGFRAEGVEPGVDYARYAERMSEDPHRPPVADRFRRAALRHRHVQPGAGAHARPTGRAEPNT